MRLLILGGTGFLGRHLVAAARARGHELTLFDRGRTAPGEVQGAERLYGEREGDLAALAGRSWDAVVDASGFTARAVAATAEALAGRADHYVFVSSVSAYADPGATGLREDAELAEAGPGYGAQKAESERVLTRAWSGTVLRLRPGVLAGPHDRSGRLAYWVRRVAAGGEVLVPGPPDRRVQILDARDLAGWLVAMAEARAEGVFNCVGPKEPLTMTELLETCRGTTGADVRFAWVEPEALRELGVEPDEFPLWPLPGLHELDGRKAFDRGLAPRPLAETIADVLEWETANSGVSTTRGPTPEREAQLLAAKPS